MFVSIHFPLTTSKTHKHLVVYLPDDYYTTDKRYPVLYINDGQNAFFDQQSYAGISWGFEEYVKKENIPVIMVAVPCIFDDEGRMNEYGPWPINQAMSYAHTQEPGKIIGGKGKAYIDDLINELVPYINRRFRTDDAHNAMIGSSMGGVITAYACLAHPEVFPYGAALSTAFWFYRDEFRQLILDTDVSRLKGFYFDFGGFEDANEEINHLYETSNHEIFDLLKDKIASLGFYYFEEATHNEESWRTRMAYFMPVVLGQKREAIEYVQDGVIRFR